MKRLGIVGAGVALCAVVVGALSEMKVEPVRAGSIGTVEVIASTVPISASVTTVFPPLEQIQVVVDISGFEINGVQTATFNYIAVEIGTSTVVDLSEVLMPIPSGSNEIPTEGGDDVIHNIQVKDKITQDYTVLIYFRLPTGFGKQEISGCAVFNVLAPGLR